MKTSRISRRSFLAAVGLGATALALDTKKIEAYAAKMGPQSQYPVVVIGAGLGGLTCAAYLARQGIPVTVVEQHSIPGGYATAFERDRGRYRFEVSLHGTALHANDSTGRLLAELGVLDKLALVPLPEMFRIRTESGEVVVPRSDPEGFVRALSDRFPEEAAGIRDFVNELVAVYEEAEAYGAKSEFYKKATKLIFPMVNPKIWSVRSKTLKDLLDDHVRSAELRRLLAFSWPYYGLPPERLSGFYYAVATGKYLKTGSYYIKERSQRLSDLLAQAVTDAGGDIIYDTSVEKVTLKDKSVSGVVLSDGRILPARGVVCNGSALALFEKMLPGGSVPAEYLQRLKTLRPSTSCFIVWLGLNRSLRGKFDGFTTNIAPQATAEASYAAALEGQIEKADYSISLYDNLFEGYSPPGAGNVMLFALSGYGPWQRFEADYRAGRKAAYQEEKQRWADTLIRRAEKDLIPGLSSMITIREAATPLTNWRFTGNTQGAIYGFEQSMENAFMNRIKNRTPIDGLYLAGAWGNPGGGYTAVLGSGRATFEMMMKDWGGQGNRM